MGHLQITHGPKRVSLMVSLSLKNIKLLFFVCEIINTGSYPLVHICTHKNCNCLFYTSSLFGRCSSSLSKSISKSQCLNFFLSPSSQLFFSVSESESLFLSISSLAQSLIVLSPRIFHIMSSAVPVGSFFGCSLKETKKEKKKETDTSFTSW